MTTQADDQQPPFDHPEVPEAGDNQAQRRQDQNRDDNIDPTQDH